MLSQYNGPRVFGVVPPFSLQAFDHQLCIAVNDPANLESAICSESYLLASSAAS